LTSSLQLNYCPQCGHRLEDREAHGRLRRACPACDVIVFREHKVAAGVLVHRQGEVLLVRRRLDPQRGLWSLPAGFVDFGEDPAETALRECREETGLEVEIAGLLAVVAGREHQRGADIVIVYSARCVGGDLAPADDVDGAAYFGPDRLPPLAFRATTVALRAWSASLLGANGLPCGIRRVDVCLTDGQCSGR